MVGPKFLSYLTLLPEIYEGLIPLAKIIISKSKSQKEEDALVETIIEELILEIDSCGTSVTDKESLAGAIRKSLKSQILTCKEGNMIRRGKAPELFK